MAKKMKVEIEVKKGDMNRKNKEFMPCSRCPNPKACMAAGKCLAESFGG